jgi:1-acyl-sn-glycerol-3-phosphate acyltransferase
MKRAISSFILRLFGWTVEVDVPDYPKCVICVAPHTSNWDFFIGKLAYLSIGRYAGFMMKKEWFFPPLGSLLTSMGGVPVSRDRHTDMVSQLVEIFKSRKRFSIAITPEATRKANADWKKGFYYIARDAEVPIVLAYIDYKDKEVGIKKVFMPTGDVETPAGKNKLTPKVNKPGNEQVISKIR